MVDRLRRGEPGEVDPADSFPHTTQDVEQLYAQLREHVASIGNTWLLRLLSSVVEDPEIVPKLKRAPAAKTMHHAYLGGLLEHIVSLCGLCRAVAAHYPETDTDLLLAGAVLHDIGKINELSYERSINYTTEGHLLGHIILELELTARKMDAIEGFPLELKRLVQHLLISHHGQYEFGSPKLPMFPEALMLHYLDDLDSKMEGMRAHFERGTEANGAWSGYNASLGRPLLNTAKFLEKDKENKLAAAEPSAVVSEQGGASGTPTPPGAEPPEKKPDAAAVTAAVDKNKI